MVEVNRAFVIEASATDEAGFFDLYYQGKDNEKVTILKRASMYEVTSFVTRHGEDIRYKNTPVENRGLAMFLENHPTFDIELHCVSYHVAKKWNGDYDISKLGDQSYVATVPDKHSLLLFMRRNCCWADDKQTLQYWAVDGVQYKVHWDGFEYMGGIVDRSV
jgi:hypothetical protein